MISRCKDCPNATRCKEMCREVKKYADQGQDKWRRGEQRKLIFLDMDIFPDESWKDDFVKGTIQMQTVIDKLASQQQEVLNLILERWPKVEIEKKLGISRWSLNHEIRAIKSTIEKNYG